MLNNDIRQPEDAEIAGLVTPAFSWHTGKSINRRLVEKTAGCVVVLGDTSGPSDSFEADTAATGEVLTLLFPSLKGLYFPVGCGGFQNSMRSAPGRGGRVQNRSCSIRRLGPSPLIWDLS